MKSKFYILLQIILSITVSVGIYSCDTSSKHAEHKTEEVYTCPMHPSVRSNKPGACTICGMTLVKKKDVPTTNAPEAENIVFLMPRQQILANIKTEKIKNSNISENNILLGTINTDPRKSTIITARVPGRIDKLFLRNPQQRINKGQPIYEIYSEELLIDQKEYLLSFQKLNSSSDNETLKLMHDASRNKLLLWGMNQAQINQLTKSGKTNPRTTFYSPENGYLQNAEIKEGQYVQVGSPIGELVKLNELWAEAQVYPEELKLLKRNPEVFIENEAIGEPLHGKLVFESPIIEDDKRLNLTRFSIENRDSKLQPGMMVYIRLQTTGKKGLVVPSSALLPEKMPTVWIKIGGDAFERRMVKLGIQNRNSTEILDGVKENEEIVVSGAYLINSEFILKKGDTQKHNH